MTIRMIVATNPQGVIGKDNKIPWFYKGDLQYFKMMTTGHVVVMGRKTWESLPPKMRPLPGRVNIVLTSKTPTEIGMENINPECMTARDMADALKCAADFAPGKDIWLIGGEQVYREGMDIADDCLVTNVPDLVDTAGATLMPSWSPKWHLHGTNPHPTAEGLTLSLWRSKTAVERLMDAAKQWRKWAAEEGGCSEHSGDPMTWCPKCQREEHVTELLWDATEFLDS
jgi:dihydrofolate reductase